MDAESSLFLELVFSVQALYHFHFRNLIAVKTYYYSESDINLVIQQALLHDLVLPVSLDKGHVSMRSC